MSLPATAVPATRAMIYLGMDVRKESITIAVLPADAKTPMRLERLPNELPSARCGWTRRAPCSSPHAREDEHAPSRATRCWYVVPAAAPGPSRASPVRGRGRAPVVQQGPRVEELVRPRAAGRRRETYGSPVFGARVAPDTQRR